MLLTGGGSGGHITPVTTIASEIKNRDNSNQIIYIGQKNDKLSYILKDNKNIDSIFFIYAGKFRRYHSEGLKQIFDLATIYKNIRDLFLIIIGLFQSYIIIRKCKPDVLFTRGGYISVPVAIAAKLNRVPFITHDSDSIASLTNRILAPYAKYNAVSVDSEEYPYSDLKKIITGIPISSNFKYVDEKLKNIYRTELNIPINSKVILIIGGGLGSVIINESFLNIANKLINDIPEIWIIHIVGLNNFEKMKKDYLKNVGSLDRIKVFGFIDDVYKYSGAADLIITRAGATNIAEFSTQGKECIIVPSPFLTGGHQVKNANYLLKNEAAIILDEKDIVEEEYFYNKIIELMQDQNLRDKISKNILKLSNTTATTKIVDLILSIKK